MVVTDLENLKDRKYWGILSSLNYQEIQENVLFSLCTFHSNLEKKKKKMQNHTYKKKKKD